MRDVLTVVTPENVTFDYELAGLTERALAALVDVALMVAVAGLAAVALTLLGMVVGGLAAAAYFVVVFAVQWGYGTLFEWRMRGQTVGKRALGLRVLSQEAAPIGFSQALVRNLLRVLDLMPWLYLVGGVTVLLDRRLRRLGDIAAGTVVVRERRHARPPAVATPAERHNSFRSEPHVLQAATRITSAERNAMVELALRRDALPLPVRFDLFGRLSAHFQARLGIERPSFFSDEKFVLNLAAVHLEMGQGAVLPAVPPLSGTSARRGLGGGRR